MRFSYMRRIASAALRPSLGLALAGALGLAHSQYVPLADVVQIASGWDHSCAIVGAGAVKCWGMNNAGALGDGTQIDRSMPVAVVGLQEGVTTLAAGGWHSCALVATGGVKCWGANGSGQLGNGTYASQLVPVDVVGLGAAAIAIAAGDDHTCAVLETGGVKCWGSNGSGQLGNGSYLGSPVPVDASWLLGARAVAAGFDYTCTLVDGGAVTCWGTNGFGQLGDGVTQGRRPTPWPTVAGLDSGVASISAKSSHTCAAMLVGKARCWGSNWAGELGGGDSSSHSTPIEVVGLGSVQSVALGNGFSCARSTEGAIECWGGNSDGTLGNGTFRGSLVPVDVALLSGALAINAGGRHACAITNLHEAVCWGNDFFGQLGNATTTQRLTPVDVIGVGSIDAVSAGFSHTCALTAASTAACWGNNYGGQLGDGTTERRLVPTDVTGLGNGVRAVSGGRRHSCAIDASGGVECWGENAYGQLGDGSTTDRATPAAISALGADNLAIATGWYHTCAITSAGGAKCWGDNSSGQLGDGSTTQRETPVQVAGLASGVLALALGETHTCALMQTGGIKCWGGNWSGELGTGDGQQHTTPVDVPGLMSGVRAISANTTMTCALTDSGMAKCWGYGVVGNGSPNGSSPTPVDVAGLSSGVVAITQGALHVCAQLMDGVRCWGRNDFGQLGDGSRETRLVPTEVVGLGGPVEAVSAGSQHTCALMATGALKCWGSNAYGQVGDGTAEGIPLPQTVVVPGDPIFRSGFE
ncbi:hypothetical protein [Dokdonella sp.]|uniref:RCC1 domain-containing protein n=1 Tax=Dokdonella sp. TaxID=2291710 RepID=UPI0037832D22